MARNKAHKSKFSSKSAVARRAQGRVAGTSTSRNASKHASAIAGNTVQVKGGNAAGHKFRARQSSTAIRRNKNEVSRAEKAVGFDGPPRIVGLVNANESGDSAAVYRSIIEACNRAAAEAAAAAAAQRRNRRKNLSNCDEDEDDDEYEDIDDQGNSIASSNGAPAPVSTELGVPVTVMFQPGNSVRLTLVCEGNDIDEQVAVDIAKVSDIVVLSLDCSAAVQAMLRDIRREGEAQERSSNIGAAAAAAASSSNDRDDMIMAGLDTRSQATWFSDVGLCITDQTRELVQYINAQGSPSIVVCLQGLDTYGDEKRRRQAVRLHERYFASVLCSDHRVVTDTPQLMRALETIKLRRVHFRDIRPYFVADDGDYDEATGELHLSGYLRGSNMSARQLVHVTNHGTFQIRQIMAPGDPCPVKKSSLPPLSGVIDESTPEQRESLVEIQASESVLTEDVEGLPSAADVFAAAREREQAEKEEKARLVAHYERAAELRAAAEAAGEDDETMNRRGNIVATEHLLNPGNVIRYEREARPQQQQGGGDTDDADRQLMFGDGAAAAAAAEQQHHDGDGTRSEMLERRSNFGQMSQGGMSGVTGRSEIEFKRSADILRYERQTEQEREEELRQLREEAEEQEHGPDEKDTPYHIPARQRFAKFRGLKSFSQSKWDPNENLPIEFGHIFKFRGFSQVREQAVRVVGEAPAPMGIYVRITLVNVPPAMWDNATDLLLVSGLLPHEHKWSVLHFRTQKNSEYEEPVKSKTPMLAHIGFRKFFCQPLFSEPVAMGGGRTKYSRYLLPGDTFKTVSFFGPISYYPTPILLFKALSLEEQNEGLPPPLVCYGAALPPDPDFLILKRVVLTGKIAVIYKNQVVIRYMFWNDEDVRYFQPIELYTRLGRRGKIKKALGTHGMFKAELSDLTMQHDVVCMDLWKRVFPKWKTVAYNVAEIADSTETKRKEIAQEDDVFDD